MRDYCKAIIDGAADVAGVAGTSLPCNLNMVAIQGIDPTEDEVSVLMKAAEDYTRTVRAIVHGWVARLPAARDRRKKEEDGASASASGGGASGSWSGGGSGSGSGGEGL